jgi:hypothetical protein
MEVPSSSLDIGDSASGEQAPRVTEGSGHSDAPLMESTSTDVPLNSIHDDSTQLKLTNEGIVHETTNDASMQVNAIQSEVTAATSVRIY